MDELTKNLIDNDLSGSSHEALNAAVQALYFDDNSDYKTALWSVVSALLEGLLPEYPGNEYLYDLVHHLNPDWTK